MMEVRWRTFDFNILVCIKVNVFSNHKNVIMTNKIPLILNFVNHPLSQTGLIWNIHFDISNANLDRARRLQKQLGRFVKQIDHFISVHCQYWTCTLLITQYWTAPCVCHSPRDSMLTPTYYWTKCKVMSVSHGTPPQYIPICKCYFEIKLIYIFISA